MNKKQVPPSALRTPRKHNAAAIRLYVWAPAVGEPPSLVGHLFFTIFADDLPFFDGFSGSERPSDLLQISVSNGWPWIFSDKSLLPSGTGADWSFRRQFKEFPYALKAFDEAGHSRNSRAACLARASPYITFIPNSLLVLPTPNS